MNIAFRFVVLCIVMKIKHYDKAVYPIVENIVNNHQKKLHLYEPMAYPYGYALEWISKPSSTNDEDDDDFKVLL